MFEENKDINEFDQMIKSILDDGQEEVPARVWDAVSEGLDNAARRKTVVLWFRRAAVSVAAAAAVAIAVIFNHKPEESLVPAAGDSALIAVVEPEDNQVENQIEPLDISSSQFIAAADATPAKKQAIVDDIIKNIRDKNR